MRLSELPGDEILTLEQAIEHLPADYTVAIVKQQIALGHIVSWRMAGSPLCVMVDDLRAFINDWDPFSRPAPKGPFVYFVQEKGTKSVKVGMAKNPLSRIGELQVGCPHEIVLIGVIPGGVVTERYYHALFAKHALRGEWYWAHEFVMGHIQSAIAMAKAGGPWLLQDPVARAHARFSASRSSEGTSDVRA